MSKTVLETLGHLLDEEYSSYLKKASFAKPAEYHTRSRQLHLALRMDAPLPFQVWQTMIHQLRLALHAAIVLEVSTEHEAGLADLEEMASYAAFFASTDEALAAFRGSTRPGHRKAP